MRVFVVGEGKNDIGDLAEQPPYRSGQEGFYQPLLRTMLDQEDVVFDGAKITQLKSKDRARSPAKAKRQKAEMAVAFAEVAEADFLVYTADGDSDLDSRRSKLVASLSKSEMPWAVAMPRTTVEAWVLGDSGALGVMVPGATPPKNPELLWGSPHDPSSNHPKAYLRRLRDEAPSTEDFAAAAGAALPSRLCHSCPDGFRPFADELSLHSGRLPCTP